MKKSRIIVKHSRQCYMKGRKNVWSGVIGRQLWGNYAANEKASGGHHLWLEVK